MAYHISMPFPFSRMLMTLCGLALVFWSATSAAESVEVFGKASYQKTNINDQKYTQSISGATGITVGLIPQLRIEARYTAISQFQNKLDVSGGILTNIKTQTSIYSVGIDLTLFNEKSTFIPFIYLGSGYAETKRTWDETSNATGVTTASGEPNRTGITGNVGLGFRIRLAKGFALELEAFAYSVDFHKAGALIDYYGTAGVRFYL